MSRKVMQQALDALELRSEHDDTYPPLTRPLNDCAIAVESLREELSKPYGWQPIETAPKYGDEIDIWAGGGRFANCVFNKPTYGRETGWVYESHHDSDGPVYELVKNPTHWMPLPKAPI